MKLYFIRHGQSEANVRREFSNRGWKHGLTDVGRRQAAALATRLREVGVCRLFTSPLLRAVETAEILSAELAIPYQTTDALREYDCGVLEGTRGEPGWQTYSEVLSDWIRYGRWDSRIEGGESFLEMRDRFVPFVEQLIEPADRASGNAALVGHGGLYRCMLPLVLENVNFDFVMAHPLGYASCVVVEKRHRGLVCLKWDGRDVE